MNISSMIIRHVCVLFHFFFHHLIAALVERPFRNDRIQLEQRGRLRCSAKEHSIADLTHPLGCHAPPPHESIEDITEKPTQIYIYIFSLDHFDLVSGGKTSQMWKKNGLLELFYYFPKCCPQTLKTPINQRVKLMRLFFEGGKNSFPVRTLARFSEISSRSMPTPVLSASFQHN